MNGRSIAMLLGALILCSCWSLPDNFPSLNLEEKVKAYEHRLKMGGAPSRTARSYISWHGKPAAQRMIPFLKGTEKGLSRRDALTIIWYVQLRGCDLKGSEAEKAVIEVLSRGGLELDEKIMAEGTLKSIAEDSHFKPGQLDLLRGGPCEAGAGSM
jgi:hypothetical protein